MSILQIYLILVYKEKDKFSNQDTQYCLFFFLIMKFLIY